MKNNKALSNTYNPSVTSATGEANLFAFFALLYKVDLRNKRAESINSAAKIKKTGHEPRPGKELE